MSPSQFFEAGVINIDGVWHDEGNSSHKLYLYLDMTDAIEGYDTYGLFAGDEDHLIDGYFEFGVSGSFSSTGVNVLFERYSKTFYRSILISGDSLMLESYSEFAIGEDTLLFIKE